MFRLKIDLCNFALRASQNYATFCFKLILCAFSVVLLVLSLDRTRH